MSEPPPGKTGALRTTGIDWLAGTAGKGVDLETVKRLLEHWFGPVSDRPGGLRFYRSSAQVGTSSLIAWDGVGDASGRVMVSLAGQDLTPLGFEGQTALLAALRLCLEFRLSRIDLYVDDYGQVVRPETVRAALEEGQTVTRTVGVGKFYSDQRGWQTVYIGSRHSASMVRVYEKAGSEGASWASAAEPTKPERVRWEAEFKGDRAEWVGSELLGRMEDPGVFFWGLVRDLVDFRDRAPGEAHGERAPMLDWWAELVGSAERIKRAVGQVLDSLADRVRWVRRQMPRTLASLWLAYGDRFVSELLADGMEKLTDRDRWMIGATAT